MPPLIRAPLTAAAVVEREACGRAGAEERQRAASQHRGADRETAGVDFLQAAAGDGRVVGDAVGSDVLCAAHYLRAIGDARYLLEPATEDRRLVGDTRRIAALNKLPAAAQRCIVVGAIDEFVAALVDCGVVGNAGTVNPQLAAAIDRLSCSGGTPIVGIAAVRYLQ